MSTYDPIICGQHAQRFLGDEVMQQIFSELKLTYFNRWVESKDPSERERLHAQARALDDLMTAIQAVADSGTLAQLEQEQRAS